MPRLCSSLLLLLLIASPASAATMDWTFVANPGNACDPQSQGCFGSVGYAYNIGTYEVTNAQYTEFLNAVADTDANGVYDVHMDPADGSRGGITRAGSAGSYSYSAPAGRENMPVNNLSFYNALRFANWMQNGQPNTGTQTSATTESGSYTLNGANPPAVTRNAGATIFLPNENEWYKAAYYDSASSTYFDYPAGSDTQTTCAGPSPAPNSANCGFVVGDVTSVGSYTGSTSPYGTFDQGGNLFEWNETFNSYGGRQQRGGSFGWPASYLAASSRNDNLVLGLDDMGFRIASTVPEPRIGILLIAGVLSLLGLAGWRRRAQ